MNTTVNVTLRMDKELKQEAEALFEEMGLSLSSACRLFPAPAAAGPLIPFASTRRPRRATRKALAETEAAAPALGSVDELMEKLEE